MPILVLVADIIGVFGGFLVGTYRLSFDPVVYLTRTAQYRLNLMIWIKLFPCLGYFPALSEIPAPLIDHIRKALDLAADVVPGYENDRTLYRHHQVVREYYQILPYGKEARRVILRTLLRAVRTMDNPADMINAALEELIKQIGSSGRL